MSEIQLLGDFQLSSMTPRELRRLYLHANQNSTRTDLNERFDRILKRSLVSGEYIAIGYSRDSGSNPIHIQSHEWRFLTIDYDKNAAYAIEGDEVLYADLRCAHQDLLPPSFLKKSEQLKDSETSTNEETRTSTFEFGQFGADTWSEITFRFLKGHFVEIGGPTQKKKYSIDAIGLMNKTEQIPNDSFNVLILCAKRRYPSTQNKHKISKLRKRLKKTFNTKSDPFSLREDRYVPVFTVVDDRDAADERAKRDAIHVSYDDTKNYDPTGSQEEYTFEEESDEADKWLRKNDH